MEKDISLSLSEYLNEQSETVIEAWFELMIDQYPSEAKKLLRHEKNLFANPVGQTLYHSGLGIFLELVGEKRQNILEKHLEEIIRIKAVQDFTPSQSIALRKLSCKKNHGIIISLSW
ncbi:MAG: RsbRD N-terminal domain-containing protein [Bacillota bacterium]|nr:RsbRD N-terminal domain-containing protein [Bacillota bacterium]